MPSLRLPSKLLCFHPSLPKRWSLLSPPVFKQSFVVLRARALASAKETSSLRVLNYLSRRATCRWYGTASINCSTCNSAKNSSTSFSGTTTLAGRVLVAARFSVYALSDVRLSHLLKRVPGLLPNSP
jgi:hypothetical protein